MDTQTNGHAKTRKAVRKGTRKATSVVNDVGGMVERAEGAAEDLVKQGVDVISKSAAGGWVARNPKKAIGMALGTGLIVGSLLDGKYLRAAAVGAIGLIAKRYF